MHNSNYYYKDIRLKCCHQNKELQSSRVATSLSPPLFFVHVLSSKRLLSTKIQISGYLWKFCTWIAMFVFLVTLSLALVPILAGGRMKWYGVHVSMPVAATRARCQGHDMSAYMLPCPNNLICACWHTYAHLSYKLEYGAPGIYAGYNI